MLLGFGLNLPTEIKQKSSGNIELQAIGKLTDKGVAKFPWELGHILTIVPVFGSLWTHKTSGHDYQYKFARQ